MQSLMEIDVEFEEGRLTCLGYLDTMDAVPDSVDGDALVLYCPSGFRVQVVRDGEVQIDGQRRPLLPGVYHSTDCGLVDSIGAPVHAPAPD